MASAYEELNRFAKAQWEASFRSKSVIRVGTAICGRAAGALETLTALKAAAARLNISAEVFEVGCLGLCYAEPLVIMSSPSGLSVLYGKVAPDRVEALCEGLHPGGNPHAEMALGVLADKPLGSIPPLAEHPMVRPQVRLATRNCGFIDPGNVYHYLAQDGYGALNKALTQLTPDKVLDEVQQSGLRGRGGAAFATAQKWRFLKGAPGPVKYILCNAEEGDPGAFNDKALLEGDPHTVLEGMILAGYATAASNGYVFIRYEHRRVIQRVTNAIAQARELGFLGKNILGTDFNFEIEVALTGESYVSGEETALMEAIEGKRAMPRYRPPFPANKGLWGKPSNINNVKTYSYVPSIVLKGGPHYASYGTERCKGTAIVCLSGAIQRPGMVEVPFDTTLRQLVYNVGGGVPSGKKLKFLQTGGPLNGMLPDSVLDTAVDFDAMAALGSSIGSGGMIVGDEDTCVVDLLRVLIQFNSAESCGKCFPCRLGNVHLLETLERMTRGEGRPGDIEKMLAFGEVMRNSLCGHGQLGTNPIAAAKRYFEAELEAHIKEHRCPAGVCDMKGAHSRAGKSEALEHRWIHVGPAAAS